MDKKKNMFGCYDAKERAYSADFDVSVDSLSNGEQCKFHDVVECNGMLCFDEKPYVQEMTGSLLGC